MNIKRSDFKAFLAVIFLTVSGVGLEGCDFAPASIEDGEPVVETYLVADEPLPRIRLTRTVEITSGYSASALAIRDASVEVRLAGLDGSADVFFSYVHSPSEPGIYEPESTDLILPGRTYHLSATVESTGEEITASTTVPTRFEISRVSSHTVVYQSETPYTLDITDSFYPGRRAIYVQSILALEPDTCELTPLYLYDLYDLYEDDDFDCTQLSPYMLDQILLNASPPLNEQSYEVNPDGTIAVPLPWFAVAFYGDALVGTAAIDDALYDFMRYQSVQTNGGTLSPGEIPNVLDHINGGRGIFSSMARVESVMTVVR